MPEELLQVPSQIVKVTTMAHRSVRIVADSQENLSDEQMAKIMGNHEKTGWLCFLPEERTIDALDLVTLPKLEWDKDEKTPGQRMRSVIFLLWKQGGEKDTFHDFYARTCERIIEQLKEKLV